VALDGEVLGTVDYLLETGANDVLVVRGERELLIPFVTGQVVTQVDLENRVLRVDWDPDF
jgi:16S rRNA processing protein RimM